MISVTSTEMTGGNPPADCSVYDVYCGVVTVGMVREIAPEVRARKLVSPDVYVVGSLCGRECDVCVCALSSNGVRSVCDCDVYCGVITVGMVREIAPEVRARKLVSPDVCVVGSLCRRECDVGVCALCSTGIRSIYDSDVYCGVITVGVVSAESCVTGSCAGPSWAPIL